MTSHRAGLSRLVRLLAAVVVGAMLGGAALAQPARPNQGGAGQGPERDLNVTNRSRQAITGLNVSPASSDNWGPERLGDATIAPGRAFRVKLGRSRDCGFDVKVTYQDGSTEETRNQDVCRNRQIAFDGSTARLPDPPAGERHEVVVANRSARAIEQVFISATAATEWGDDRLDQPQIAAGDQVSLTWRGGCEIDLRVVFDNRAAEERRGLDICDQGSIGIMPGWTTAEDVPTPDTVLPGAAAPDQAAPGTPMPDQGAPDAPGSVTHVRNAGPLPIVALYADPPGRPRGADRLGDSVLGVGQSFDLPPPAPGQCRVKLTGVFRDGREAGIEGDLCAGEELVLQ